MKDSVSCDRRLIIGEYLGTNLCTHSDKHLFSIDGPCNGNPASHTDTAETIGGLVHKLPPHPGSFSKFQILVMISSASAAGDSPVPARDVSGNISSIFDDKSKDTAHPRFSELKKMIWKDSMMQSWTQVLAALKDQAEQIESLGSKASNMCTQCIVCTQRVAS